MAHILEYPFSEDHPCFGLDCKDCETCKFDRPIEELETPARPAEPTKPRCNECGYLMRLYKDGKATTYNASCSKHLIQTENVSRPRIIAHDVADGASVEVPDWCPKINEREEFSPKRIILGLGNPVQYDEYTIKKNQLKELPRRTAWDDIVEDEVYVVPRIMKSRRKIVKVLDKTKYMLRCIELNEDLSPTGGYQNVYSADLDANFIVKYHKF